MIPMSSGYTGFCAYEFLGIVIGARRGVVVEETYFNKELSVHRIGGRVTPAMVEEERWGSKDKPRARLVPGRMVVRRVPCGSVSCCSTISR
jgi:hypothetical protein